MLIYNKTAIVFVYIKWLCKSSSLSCSFIGKVFETQTVFVTFKKVWWQIVWTRVKEFSRLFIEHSVVMLETQTFSTQDVSAYPCVCLLWCGHYSTSRFIRISAVNRMLSNSYGHSASLAWREKVWRYKWQNSAGVKIKTYSISFQNIFYMFYI